jgi:DNA-binding winged helix-turn-helix (wHTH) protein
MGTEPSYRFGQFLLDPKLRLLLRDGQPVQLRDKAFDVLTELVRQKGATVTKDDLRQRVWQLPSVTDNTINVTVGAVRKALGDLPREPRYIRTTPQGYCLIAEVNETAERGDGPLPFASGAAGVSKRKTGKLEGGSRRLLLLATLGGVAVLVIIALIARCRSVTPLQVTNLGALTLALPDQELRVRIEGEGINPNTVQVVVLGPGCPRIGNCVVPNNVLGGVSDKRIESVPLRLAAGDYQIYLRNGSAGQLSNGWPLNVSAATPVAEIVVDGSPDDWSTMTPLLVDPVGAAPLDFSGRYYPDGDFRKIFVTNDNTHVYFLMEFADKFVGGDIALFLDTDLDPNTGCNGAEYTVFVSADAGGAHLALGDWRACTRKEDFPGAVVSAARARFVEASVGIEKLRILTRDTKGFRLSATAAPPPPRRGVPDDVSPPATYHFE